MPWYIVSDGDFNQFNDRMPVTPINACMVNAWQPANAISSAADIMRVKQNARLYVRLATKVLYVGTITHHEDVSGDLQLANKRHKIEKEKEECHGDPNCICPLRDELEL